MGKFLPYLKLAGSVILILAIYKIALQPFITNNATAAKYLPSV